MDLDPVLLSTETKIPAAGSGGVSKSAAAEQEKLKKAAKDFESVMVHQVMNVMKDTVQKDEENEDSSSEQIQGLYWSFMAQAVGEGGGFGMWKDLYSTMAQQQKAGSIEPDTDGRPGLDERI
jgi:Rod binding domain-containing protein